MAKVNCRPAGYEDFNDDFGDDDLDPSFDDWDYEQEQNVRKPATKSKTLETPQTPVTSSEQNGKVSDNWGNSFQDSKFTKHDIVAILQPKPLALVVK